ncbi:MAG: hypothetical protein EXS36_08350 [Pedosphaera sp.]|nr:hypothetical protein [Pedosphaera sp.]
MDTSNGEEKTPLKTENRRGSGADWAERREGKKGRSGEGGKGARKEKEEKDGKGTAKGASRNKICENRW